MRTLTIALRSALTILVLGLLASGVTSCNKTEKRGTRQFDPSSFNIPWTAENVWSDMNVDAPLRLNPFEFSHTTYRYNDGLSWYGFCPSRRMDLNLYENWTGNELNVMAPTAFGGTYLVAHWNPREPLNGIPSQPSVCIRMQDGSPFTLTDIYFANTTYGFYTMYNNSPATGGIRGADWCRVAVIGVQNGVEACRQEVYLAKNNGVLGDLSTTVTPLGSAGWQKANFKEFDDLDYVYFQIEASTTEDGNLLVPPYFVIGPVIYSPSASN